MTVLLIFIVYCIAAGFTGALMIYMTDGAWEDLDEDSLPTFIFLCAFWPIVLCSIVGAHLFRAFAPKGEDK